MYRENILPKRYVFRHFIIKNRTEFITVRPALKKCLRKFFTLKKNDTDGNSDLYEETNNSRNGKCTH